MTQEKSIKIWLEGAKDALDTANKLFDNKKYNHSLFFFHLALEKILKAVYVSMKDEAAPYSHNLVDLAHKLELDLNEKDYAKLAEISDFNVSARYESHKYKIYKKATKDYSAKWLEICKDYYQYFLKLI
ncbi:MAG: hypothetical protein ACD_19C00176G0033 [uncultured bacterium]|nr:MAG: hypothetical protein ACD_19C00176G0033 [uncultured bacterium]